MDKPKAKRINVEKIAKKREKSESHEDTSIEIETIKKERSLV